MILEFVTSLETLNSIGFISVFKYITYILSLSVLPPPQSPARYLNILEKEGAFIFTEEPRGRKPQAKANAKEPLGWTKGNIIARYIYVKEFFYS